MPSTSHLASKMIQHIDFENAGTIVELGPGTGAFTRHILQKKKNHTDFFALELNNRFHQHMLENFPLLPVYNDSAANIKNYLQKHQKTHVDAIVSSLPFAAFSETMQDQILHPALDALKPDGHFATFAYLQGLILPAGVRLKQKLKKLFSNVHMSPITWLNFPPAIVYWCKK